VPTHTAAPAHTAPRTLAGQGQPGQVQCHPTPTRQALTQQHVRVPYLAAPRRAAG
jgi:hypothetical protein